MIEGVFININFRSQSRKVFSANVIKHFYIIIHIKLNISIIVLNIRSYKRENKFMLRLSCHFL